MEKSIKAGIWRANLESRSEENQAMLVSLSHSLPALRLRCHGTFGQVQGGLIRNSFSGFSSLKN